MNSVHVLRNGNVKCDIHCACFDSSQENFAYDNSKKQSKKATSIRKGGRSTPGEPIMNYIESEYDEDEK